MGGSHPKGKNYMIIVPGDRFWKLEVLEPATSDDGRSRWKCRCDCGQVIITRQDKLAAGRVKSCGCLRQQIAVAAHAKKVASELPEWEKQKIEITTCLRELRRALVVADKLSSRAIATKLWEKLGEGFNKIERHPDGTETRHFHQEGTPACVAESFKLWALVMFDILKTGPANDWIGLDVYFYRKPNPSSEGQNEVTNIPGPSTAV